MKVLCPFCSRVAVRIESAEFDLKVECECGFRYETNWQAEYESLRWADTRLVRDSGALPVRTEN